MLIHTFFDVMLVKSLSFLDDFYGNCRQIVFDDLASIVAYLGNLEHGIIVTKNLAD